MFTRCTNLAFHSFRISRRAVIQARQHPRNIMSVNGATGATHHEDLRDAVKKGDHMEEMRDDTVPEAQQATNGTAPTNGHSKPSITVSIGGAHNLRRLHAISRDFRSDTITIPTDEMLIAGLSASRGDDVYRDDDDTIRLEERIARLAGKEAGMFVVSGTQSNQVAIRTHLTNPPYSVILDHRAHVHKFEAGAMAVISQATAHALVPSNGHHLTLMDDVIPNLELGTNIHTAPNKLICLENTLGGRVFPQEEIVRIGEMARGEGLIMHLDGARIWEVAAKEIGPIEAVDEEQLRATLTTLLEPFDSVSLCMSKGLGAPIGSVLVGPAAFINKARWFRKMLGGGIRQCGALAVAADLALTNHFPKLLKTHELAARLQAGIEALGGKVQERTETNMVWMDLPSLGIPLDVLQARADGLEDPIVIRGSRMVVHHQITDKTIDDLLALLKDVQAECAKEGGRAGKQHAAVGDLAAKYGNGRTADLKTNVTNVARAVSGAESGTTGSPY